MTAYSVEWITRMDEDTYKSGGKSFDNKEDAMTFMTDLVARYKKWDCSIINLRLITYEEIDLNTLEEN